MRQFIARVTQAANAFHALGVGRGDVVSVLLPLLPQAFFALFGAQAAGIANPVNPLLSADADRRDPARRRHQGAGHARARAGLRHPGQGAADPRRGCPTLKAVLVVHGAGDGRRPGAARLRRAARRAARPTGWRSGRRIRPDDTAGYFHTGGTTGTPKLVRHTHAQPGLPGLGDGADAAACGRGTRCCSACRCSTSAAR